MEVALESNGFFIGIEYLATFCCGMVGGLAAVRKGYDIFAILVTTWLTALGGGIIRDVLLGALPPAGVSDKGLVITALLAAVAVAIIYPEVDKLKWSMLSLDALALGLYAVNGTSKAMMYHMYGTTAVLLGMLTALGGVLIRDMLINDVPMVKAAGLGVSMENGCPMIRECADYITASNEADGVARVIERFMLEKPAD